MSVVTDFEKLKRFNFGQLQIEASQKEDEKEPVAPATAGDEAKEVVDDVTAEVKQEDSKTGDEAATAAAPAI